MSSGKLIVIEGLDGCGKTTQSKILYNSLKQKGYDVFLEAEPTTGEYGKMCRSILSGKESAQKSALSLLFTLDRIDHNKKPGGIFDHIDNGDILILDRYYYSTFAYQGVDVGLSWLMNLNLGCPDIKKPDVCVFLDLDPVISLERINKSRTPAEIEIYENLSYLKNIRERFMEVFSILKNSENIAFVDAGNSIERVSLEIEKKVNSVL